MGKFSEYKIPLKSMPVGVQDFEFQIGKQFFVNMENNDVRDAAIAVKLRVEHKNDVYDFSFVVTGQVTVGCDRCLDDLELPIDTTYHIIVKYGDDYRDDADDFIEIPYSDNDINVAYMIHDTIALAIPIKHVHPLGKCNRAMSAILKRHRTSGGDAEEGSLEESLIDEMDYMDMDAEADGGEAKGDATDSRWDKLRDFNPENN